MHFSRKSDFIETMVRIPKTDHITFLIQRKFPGYGRVVSPSRPAKPYTPASNRTGSSITSSQDLPQKTPPSKSKTDAASRLAKYLAEVESYREELEKLTNEELGRLYEEERKKKLAEDDKERFFSQPSADADFDYWSKMAHWTLDEAVALSFGKSPKVVNKKSLSSVGSWQSPFVEEYNQTFELAQRAIPWKKLFDPVLPSLFVRWAQETEISVPDELVEMVESRSGKLLDWRQMYEEFQEKNAEYVRASKEIIAAKDREIADLLSQVPVSKTLGTKERESILKLVIAMSIGGYGYDPNAKRSPIPQQIADDLVGQGISMDVDTVRKWLKEAAEFLPGSPEDGSD